MREPADLDLDEYIDVPPPPSPWTIYGLGIAAAAALLAWGAHTWITGEAEWMSWRRYGSNMDVRNDTARAIAVLKGFAAAFVHLRWFWGARGYEATFRLGTRLALVGMIGTLIYGIYTIFF